MDPFLSFSKWESAHFLEWQRCLLVSLENRPNLNTGVFAVRGHFSFYHFFSEGMKDPESKPTSRKGVFGLLTCSEAKWVKRKRRSSAGHAFPEIPKCLHQNQSLGLLRIRRLPIKNVVCPARGTSTSPASCFVEGSHFGGVFCLRVPFVGLLGREAGGPRMWMDTAPLGVLSPF